VKRYLDNTKQTRKTIMTEDAEKVARARIVGIVDPDHGMRVDLP
jgi:hypothetical protein